jgi:predicted secreted hydrolase
MIKKSFCVFVGLFLLWLALAEGGPLERLMLRESLKSETVETLKGDVSDFKVAQAPRRFDWPADHGPHPQFKTEWWYWTGNLLNEQGQPLGFQLTFFRSGIRPTDTVSNDLHTQAQWMGHLAISDISEKQFYAHQIYSREGRVGKVQLAGANANPFQVQVAGWSVEQIASAPWTLRARARSGEQVQIDLTMQAETTPVLQGENGLSIKSAGGKSASYYYSIPRMTTKGTITIERRTHKVMGLSWLDREWSTSALTEDQKGWDWMALHGENEDLIVFRLRNKDGSTNFAHAATISHDGKRRALDVSGLQVETLRRWRSPVSGSIYPVEQKWILPKENLQLFIRARLDAQELNLDFRYWEGSIFAEWTRNSGAIKSSDAGLGYLELTGY